MLFNLIVSWIILSYDAVPLSKTPFAPNAETKDVEMPAAVICRKEKRIKETKGYHAPRVIYT